MVKRYNRGRQGLPEVVSDSQRLLEVISGPQGLHEFIRGPQGLPEVITGCDISSVAFVRSEK